MAWNSQIADNEYTTLEQRKKQNASRQEFAPDYKVPPTTAEPVYEKVTVAAAAPARDSGFDEYKALLAQMKAEKQRQVNAAYEQGKQSLDNARLAADKDAYITYMRGLKNMPQMSAVSGNGGYAQSLLNKQQLNYENNRSGIAQNYFDNLRQLQTNRDNSIISANQDYLSDMAGLIKNGVPSVSNAADTTTSNVFGGKYKVGGKTLSRDEYLAYLAGYGMDAEEAAAYMAKNKIPY